MNQLEKVSQNEYGDITCICGNEPYLYGFYSSTGAGVAIEDDGNAEFCCCDQCGRIIRIDTLEVIGQRTVGAETCTPHGLSADEQSRTGIGFNEHVTSHENHLVQS